MAKTINKTMIGGFVLLAIILLITGVLVFGSGKIFKHTTEFIMYFQNPVKGLTVGSLVTWHGAPVGKVKKLSIHFDENNLKAHVPVIIELDNSIILEETDEEFVQANFQKWVGQGLRAQLSISSIITGQMQIEIIMNPDSPAKLVNLTSEYPEIPTIASNISKFMESISKLPIEEISKNILKVSDNLVQVLGSPELPKILANIEKSSKGLEQLFEDTDNLVLNTDKRIENISENIITAISNIETQIEKITNSVHKIEVDTRDAIKGVSKGTQTLIQHFDKKTISVGSKMEIALDKTYTTLSQVDKTLASFNDLVGRKSVTRSKLDKSLEDIAAAARSLKSLMDYLERHPESILQGKGKSND